MANTSNCHICGSTEDCSCKQQALHISQICNPIDCSTEECTEVFKAECIQYTGEDIICNDVIVVSTDTNVAQALANTIAFFCEQDVIENDIICDSTVIVAEGTELDLAIQQLANYFCTEIANINAAMIDTSTVTFSDAVDGDGCTIRTWTINLLAGVTLITTLNFDTPPICPPTEVCNFPDLGTPPDTTSTNFVVCDDGNEALVSYSDLITDLNTELSIPAVGGIFAQTADSTPVTDPSSGSLVGVGVGSLVFSANSLQIGDSFRAKLAGHITCSNTQELTILVRDGNGNTLATTGTIDLKTATDNFWNLEIDLTVRTLGVTGSIVNAGMWTYIPDPAGQAFEGSDFSDTATIDTTISNTFEVVASWNLNEGGVNSIYSEIFILNKNY